MKSDNNHIKLAVLIAAILALSGNAGSIHAQSCGFGCLGLSGFYGGYTVQKYNPQGLNDFIRAYNASHSSTLTKEMDDFGRAEGLRLGANFFRTRGKLLFFSLKGHYQFLKEEHELHNLLNSKSVTNTYTLNLNNYGLGLDLGLSLFRFFDWKVIDAQVVIISSDFSTRSSLTEDKLNNADFKSEKKIYGYNVGTGFIINIVPDYLSIEGTAGYTKFAVDKLKNEDETVTANSFDSISNFIKDGGISGTLQVNIGIPLY